VVRGDKAYRYAKVVAALTSLAIPVVNLYHQDIMYAVCPTTAVIGSNVVEVTVGAGDGIANDGVEAAHSLEGGSILFFDDATFNHCYNFTILDNAAAVSGGHMKITIDGTLPEEITGAAWHAEVMGSPYIVNGANVGTASCANRAAQGYPMAFATVGSLSSGGWVSCVV
jgi:hypothetical protein